MLARVVILPLPLVSSLLSALLSSVLPMCSFSLVRVSAFLACSIADLCVSAVQMLLDLLVLLLALDVSKVSVQEALRFVLNQTGLLFRVPPLGAIVFLPVELVQVLLLRWPPQGVSG